MIRTFSRAVCVLLGLGWAFAGSAAEIPRPEHPTPDAERPHWDNLNGTWDFRFDPKDEGKNAKWFEPGSAGFDRKIIVPFGWESELSGIQQPKGAPKVGWYRRSFKVPGDWPKGNHVWLRFGAVDETANVWVNGKHVTQHDGGYTPFEVDITAELKAEGENVVVLRAYDPTDPSHPTGKQVGWYTTTSGIWQTAWLESRPKTFIESFSVNTTLEPAEAVVSLRISGLVNGKSISADIRTDDPTIGRPAILPGSGISALGDRFLGIDGKAGEKSEPATLQMKIPVKNPVPWSPDSPHLYEITIELKDPESGASDSIKTYFGLRTIARGKYGDETFERVLLNGKPIFLRGALDQSFNPKGIYTAPSDAFLKKDIELAKSMGINFLRIHIKPDEPRRLYWADKLGMLIMEDMPNTWRQNAEARSTWEKTMREVVARDRNHPSIFAWVDFNETWGLGSPPQYKADKDTQQWVRNMVAETRKLDPTRLVEDNSPCNYDHVEGTDLNSWHFYIDDHEEAARHVAEVVKNSAPGSTFNYCPGQKMNTAPLINSEYGSVGAGSGDRDVSWGFRDLTTLQRKYRQIQGYIYTELTDIEWEHNGFYNYDRSPKDFGYGAYVPGMTPADLQGADFIGYDGPPAIVVKVGELIPVNLFVSHYSERKDPPTLKWWITGYDDMGEVVDNSPRERPVEWVPYGVKEQKRIAFRLHSPFVGAVALTLVDKAGQRIAANFVNVVVQPQKPAARVERGDAHEVALRFAAEDFATSEWSEKSVPAPPGKAYGRGKGALTYKLKLPAAAAKAKPQSFHLLLEAASRAGSEKRDWPERSYPLDYPQTDVRKWPTTLEVTFNGKRVARLDLEDDPADARGVLSHLARVDHGSHGEILNVSGELPESVKTDLASGKPLIVRLVVPADAKSAGGLSIYGASTGAFPFDPTVILHTEAEMPENLGVNPDDPVAIDSAASRESVLLAAGDSQKKAPARWVYTTTEPGRNWTDPKFDASPWQRGTAGFGSRGTPGVAAKTPWDSAAIWLRNQVEVPSLDPEDSIILHLFHDEDCEIFINGKMLFSAKGYVTGYQDIILDDAQRSLFRPGGNAIAVSCKQTGGGQGIDVGLKLIKAR
jgi:hypothetical protein